MQPSHPCWRYLQVPKDAAERDLRPLFEPFGEIISLNVLRTQRGQGPSAGIPCAIPNSYQNVSLAFTTSAVAMQLRLGSQIAWGGLNLRSAVEVSNPDTVLQGAPSSSFGSGPRRSARWRRTMA